MKNSAVDVITEKAWLGGRLQYATDQNGIGESNGYHESGLLKFRYPMLKGKFHGLGRSWSENGQLVCEEPYTNGELHGTRREWHISGAIKAEQDYKSGQPVCGKGWHPDGKLEFEEVFENGKLCGWRRSWHPNGQLESEYFYQQGQPVEGKQWFDTGQIECEEFFSGGREDGLQREWHKNGQLKLEVRFVRGVLEGARRAWFEDGKPELDERYQAGRRHGLFRLWTPNGDLKEKYFYIRGVQIEPQYAKLLEDGALSARIITRIQNAEVRRVCLEEYGYARFLTEVKHEIVDRDGEQELVKLRWHPREEMLWLVKVKCPSTGAFYTLRVPPEMKTVKAAVAWTFDVEADKYDPVKET